MIRKETEGVFYYSFFGLTLEVNCKGVECRSLIEELLAPFPFTLLNFLPNKADLKLEVGLSSQELSLPKTSSGASNCFGLNVVETGSERYISDGDSIFCTDISQGFGKLIVTESFVNKSPFDKNNLFLLGFFPLLLKQGFFDLHAAGVAYHGRGYLLVGDSGSGKSTAALNLVSQGWRCLSDDALLLRECPAGVEALGFRKKLFIDQRSAARHPGIEKYFEKTWSEEQSKRVVDVEKRYPGKLIERTFPEILIFTQLIDASESTLLPLDQTPALIRLLHQSASLAFNRQFAQAHLVLLNCLIKQSKSFELAAGRDLHENPGKLSSLLLNLSPRVTQA